MGLITLIESSTLIKQGAEAKVYCSTPYKTTTSSSSILVPPPKLLLKYRFPKTYRHPTLDKTITKQRLSHEARCLLKCSKSNVNVPGVRCVSLEEGILGIEWIDGNIVRDVLGGLPEDPDAHFQLESDPTKMLDDLNMTRESVLELVGQEIAKMHLSGVVHGDLTTSNMILKDPSTSIDNKVQLVLIDFGLASVTVLPEDRAVDLYVLERAFNSTHPEPEFHHTSDYQSNIDLVLNSYSKTMGRKDWTPVVNRLEEVRLRGRKRSMVG